MADRLEAYSKWLIDNEDKKDTPQWKSVAADYNALRKESQLNAPELVAGSSAQKRLAQEENLRREIGTTEPVKLPIPVLSPMGVMGIQPLMHLNTVGPFQRLMVGAAPTKEDLRTYREFEYGKGGAFEIGDNALVRVPDGKGGHKLVVENPRGFDMGDIAQAAASLPELITGVTTAMAVTPGPQAGFAKLAQISGLSALASGVVGAIQDAAFRAYTDQDIRPGEILKRRSQEVAFDATVGTLLPAGVQKIANNYGAKQAVKRFISAFEKEGETARQALTNAGVKATTTQDSADAVRALVPANTKANEAGEQIANALTRFDEQMRGGAGRLTRGAARDASARGQQVINQAASPISLNPSKVGKLAITGVKQDAVQSRALVKSLYDAAKKEIASAVKVGNIKGDDFIVSLDSTKKVIEESKELLMRTAKNVKGKPTGVLDTKGNMILGRDTTEYGTSDMYAAMLAQLKKIGETTGATQRLDAVRSTRSMIGQSIRSEGGVFDGMEPGMAKQLYKALSEDLERSVSKYTGPGAAQLKAADAEYSKLISKYDTNPLLSKMEQGSFDGSNPEQVIQALTKGGTDDWALLQSTLPPNTFNAVRRSAMDTILNSQTSRVAGEEVVDIAKMGSTLKGMTPEVKNTIFGGPRVWTSLQKIGEEAAFIERSSGLLTRPALPSQQAIQEITEEARSLGVDRINQQFRRAVKAAETRRNNIGSAIASQIKSGNVSTPVGNPQLLLDTIIFSGNYSPQAVAGMLTKLPKQSREDIQNAAFQYIFENAKEASASTVGKGVASYNSETMLKKVFGSEQQRKVIENVVGPEKFKLIEDWTKFTNAKAIVRAVADRKQSGRKIANLVSRLPYANLFAASAASTVLERASGRAFLASATPEASELFAQARLLESNPQKTAAGIALLQRVLNMPNYGNYRDMMSELPPEQRDALDQYLND